MNVVFAYTQETAAHNITKQPFKALMNIVTMVKPDIHIFEPETTAWEILVWIEKTQEIMDVISVLVPDSLYEDLEGKLLENVYPCQIHIARLQPEPLNIPYPSIHHRVIYTPYRSEPLPQAMLAYQVARHHFEKGNFRLAESHGMIGRKYLENHRENTDFLLYTVAIAALASMRQGKGRQAFRYFHYIAIHIVKLYQSTQRFLSRLAFDIIPSYIELFEQFAIGEDHELSELLDLLDKHLEPTDITKAVQLNDGYYTIAKTIADDRDLASKLFYRMYRLAERFLISNNKDIQFQFAVAAKQLGDKASYESHPNTAHKMYINSLRSLMSYADADNERQELIAILLDSLEKFYDNHPDSTPSNLYLISKQILVQYPDAILTLGQLQNNIIVYNHAFHYTLTQQDDTEINCFPITKLKVLDKTFIALFHEKEKTILVYSLDSNDNINQSGITKEEFRVVQPMLVPYLMNNNEF
jgi:hypothetical protein